MIENIQHPSSFCQRDECITFYCTVYTVSGTKIIMNNALMERCICLLLWPQGLLWCCVCCVSVFVSQFRLGQVIRRLEAADHCLQSPYIIRPIPAVRSLSSPDTSAFCLILLILILILFRTLS